MNQYTYASDKPETAIAGASPQNVNPEHKHEAIAFALFNLSSITDNLQGLIDDINGVTAPPTNIENPSLTISLHELLSSAPATINSVRELANDKIEEIRKMIF